MKLCRDEGRWLCWLDWYAPLHQSFFFFKSMSVKVTHVFRFSRFFFVKARRLMRQYMVEDDFMLRCCCMSIREASWEYVLLKTKCTKTWLWIRVMEMCLKSLSDWGFGVWGTGVTKAVFQSTGHWLWRREALVIEARKVTRYGAYLWWILIGRSTGVVDRLDLCCFIDLATLYSWTGGNGDGEGRSRPGRDWQMAAK